ncbi:hypothetical protein CAPTEDRAFT_221824 [Capitella teleta]|uniref:Phosducin domain-containing protein n=1 Tax=Capitella teleta TaxID=283909 RepID=R7V2N9_CAPTE|nr:hypothetical protein CAPTEDRAFT_221824 [Capitella teleta]|eukprot:ELU09971.1 hypothetical protein CAPTEDRAFT_221824 [Capitella teleta]
MRNVQLLDELECGEIPAHIREARLAEFKRQAKNFHEFADKQHGQYTEIEEEKNFLAVTTSEDKCVVHFFHDDFRRCAIMDTHLKVLAEKYFETKFAKINVTKAKFFVDKLKIRVLPAVVCFNKGVVVDRIVGFDDLGNTDSFPVSVLEHRLSASGVIKVKGSEDPKNKSILGRTQKDEESNSDDDW